MIPEPKIRTAIINRLRQFVSFGSMGEDDITILSSNIRENQVQYDTLTYPALRISVDDQTPIGNGTRTKLSTVLFSIWVQSEKPGSLECETIGGFLSSTDGLFDRQIFTSELRLIRIDVMSESRAIRGQDRIWTKQIFFRSECHAPDVVVD